MRTNKTMLTHPTFLNKIREAMLLTLLGEGDKMNGHEQRAYIQNRKGREVMRCHYDGNTWVFHGDLSVNCTNDVMKAVKDYENELAKQGKLY